MLLFRRVACAVTLAAAGVAAAAPLPRLWEAVKPAEPGVRIYILAAGGDGGDGYFDRIVMPAFAQSHVLHRELSTVVPDTERVCGRGRIFAVDVDPASGARHSSCSGADRDALLRAASMAAPGADCARAGGWLDEIARMTDGLTHFVIADVTQAPGCKGLLGRLADAGYVLWPVAEFGPEQAAR